jgi:hypothetical protein
MVLLGGLHASWERKMKKERINLKMRVEFADGRIGTVINLRPDSKYLVNVLIDGLGEVSTLAEVLKVAKVNPLARDLADGFYRYSTDQARAIRKWEFKRWYPELAWIVGFAAQQNAALVHSGQPNGGRAVEDEFQFGKDSHGEKFDVVMSNPNYAELDDVTDINFIHRDASKRGLRTVQLNKEGFYKFLESLGFKVGREQDQDVVSIRREIPTEYLADFDAGTRGSVPSSARRTA